MPKVGKTECQSEGCAGVADSCNQQTKQTPDLLEPLAHARREIALMLPGNPAQAPLQARRPRLPRAPDIRELKRRAIIWVGLTVPLWIDKILVRYSVHGDPPIYDTSLFDWAAELEAAWPLIRSEAQQVLTDRQLAPPLRYISRDHERIAKDDKWRSFFLWGYGVRSDANCARCPETARLVERIPGLQTALFSILAPGAHIPRHNGVTKAFLTCHMGLSVPKDRARCHIRVHEQDYSWREGELFVFDDLYYHEVWNDTDEERINLMLHVDRPLRFPGTLVRDGVMWLIRRSPFIKDAARKIDDWTVATADPRRPAEWTPHEAR